MGKHTTRWPIWKIAAATGGLAAVAALLFWLSAVTDQAGGEQATDPLTRAPVLSFSVFLMMMAIAVAILGVLGLVWLGFRIQEARTPVWERRGKKKRR
jgi:hypothetical protein